MNLHIGAQTIRLTMLLVVLIGLLVVAYGAYDLIDTNNRYSALAAIPEPSQDELQNIQPGDASIMSLAALDRDKRDLLARRGRDISILGFGAVLLGFAVVIYMRLPEQPSAHA